MFPCFSQTENYLSSADNITIKIASHLFYARKRFDLLFFLQNSHIILTNPRVFTRGPFRSVLGLYSILPLLNLLLVFFSKSEMLSCLEILLQNILLQRKSLLQVITLYIVQVCGLAFNEFSFLSKNYDIFLDSPHCDFELLALTVEHSLQQYHFCPQFF